MSVATSKSTDRVGIPQTDRLRRIVIETSKFLDEPHRVPAEEVRIQASANGYTDREIKAFLERNGIAQTNEILVPEQGDLLGDVWRVEDTAGVPSPDAPTEDPHLTKFRKWLSSKAEQDTSHSYTRRAANKRFAQGKDVERSFVKQYETFSTVLLTYCAGPADSGEPVVAHTDKFYPRAVVRKRRQILKELDVWSGYAGVSVLAPKKADPRVPHPDAPIVRTHAHDFLWLPGAVPEDAFYPVIEKHVAKVDGATDRLHPLTRAVTVEVHDSAEVSTPNQVTARGAALDEIRGYTTAFPQELGNNLPLLLTRFDARGLPDYAERWSARLRLGRDESLDTSGVVRFRPLGRFNDLADTMKTRRKVRNAWANAVVISRQSEGIDSF